MEKTHLRVIMLHEFKLRRSVSEATQNIKMAWGEDSANERTVRRWYQKFRVGDVDLEDKDRSGRPAKCDDGRLKERVEADSRGTVREMGRELQVSRTTISRHLEAIGKVKKLDKWVPHELTEEQQRCRLEICSSLTIRNENDPFLDRIITCDEKWIVYDNRRRSAQWLDKEEPPKHFPKPSLHPRKVMLTVWWAATGIIHYDFLKPGETITAERYCRELDVVHQKLLEMRPALVNRRGPILLHDNARPHVSHLTTQKLNQLRYEVLPHPAYSPDLAPTDFHLFKHLDGFLKDKNFTNVADIEIAFECFIASRNSDFFRNGINALVYRWQKCIDCNGSYFD